MMPRTRRPASSLAVRFSSCLPLVLATAMVACSPDSEGTANTSGTSGGAGGGTGQGGEGQGGDTGTNTTGTGTGGAGTGGAGTGGEGGAGGGEAGCTTDDDCAGDPDGKTLCDVSSGECVGCLPDDDQCPDGQYCNQAEKQCKPGCTGDEDCEAPSVCNPDTHQCVGCAEDDDCGPGTICVNDACAEGCTPDHACQPGFTCCGSQCYDLAVDEGHCGQCNIQCPVPDNGEALCEAGVCTLGACNPGFADCNLDPSDGCEWNVLQDGDCVCKPGDEQTCYQGAPGTEGKGLCKAGEETCDASGTSWGPCVGQVLPQPEICANGVDEDCDGTKDNVADQDGDGWTMCDGDCCDSVIGGGCQDPKIVNPGAFEVPGNGVDDNCDGVTDNALPTCDQGLASNSGNGLDYAKAVDICQTALENPPTPKEKKWGVIKAELLKADGTANPAAKSRAIRSGFGTAVTPKKGSSLAVLSTGAAADKNDSNPSYTNWQATAASGANDTGTQSKVPLDWYQANGNSVPNAPQCPKPDAGVQDTALNPIMLKVRVRVPTNAKSFSLGTYFFSSEYPEWVCSPYNDFFVALLDSQFKPGAGEVANPKDKNLATFASGGKSYPVGVNLATGNTGLFQQCKNGSIGCANGSMPGTTNACKATNELAGTGFDDANPAPSFPGDVGYCGANNLLGGGTGWLVTSGNVKPGEVMEIRFAVWDTNDPWYDSVVLIDNFAWSVVASDPGTHL